MKNIEMFMMKSGSVLCQHHNLVQTKKDQSIQLMVIIMLMMKDEGHVKCLMGWYDIPLCISLI